MRIVRTRASARVGLLGNPSDGYHGKTLALAIDNFHAQVVLYPWEQLEIVRSDQDRNRFNSLDELVKDVNLNGYYGGMRLIKATIKRFADYCRDRDLPLRDEPFSIRYQTDIPQGVGLAGSSAIVVAALRALMEYYSVEIPRRVQPSLARAVENSELGIACGLQDRVAQVYDGLVDMDFSVERTEWLDGYECGHYEPLEPSRLPPLYICYDPDAAKVSGDVHQRLRDDVNRNQHLTAVMSEIASLVPLGRQAIERGDVPRLHELMNRNFDLRQQLYTISPPNLQMIEAARNVGASAKFAGSGGAIVGVCEDDAMFDRLRQALESPGRRRRVLRVVPRGLPGEQLDTAAAPIA